MFRGLGSGKNVSACIPPILNFRVRIRVRLKIRIRFRVKDRVRVVMVLHFLIIRTVEGYRRKSLRIEISFKV